MQLLPGDFIQHFYLFRCISLTPNYSRPGPFCEKELESETWTNDSNRKKLHRAADLYHNHQRHQSKRASRLPTGGSTAMKKNPGQRQANPTDFNLIRGKKASDYPTQRQGLLRDIWPRQGIVRVMIILLVVMLSLCSHSVEAAFAPTIPSADLTSAPTGPTSVPSARPTCTPTTKPTDKPTDIPTVKPTTATTVVLLGPTLEPSTQPSRNPTSMPTDKPTDAPTAKPTPHPTLTPTVKPTDALTAAPSGPTFVPSAQPTRDPTAEPTGRLTATARPSANPSVSPSSQIQCSISWVEYQALYSLYESTAPMAPTGLGETPLSWWAGPGCSTRQPCKMGASNSKAAMAALI